MSKLTAKQQVDIVRAYTEGLVPVIELARITGVSRQAIYRVLQKAGVDTTKNGGIKVSCSCCQKIITRPRSRVRVAKKLFCGQACYTAWLQAGAGTAPLIASRQGQRIGRQVASRYITLEPDYVVHHINRNALDNDPRNLIVFRCNGDHIRHHRGFEVEPVWDGSKAIKG